MKLRITVVTLFVLLCMVILSACSGQKEAVYTYYNLFAETDEPYLFMLDEDKIAGVYINNVRDFCGFEVTASVPSFSENTVVLSVYEYTDGYEDSLAGSPLYTASFSNVKDGQTLYLQFEDLEYGKYILTVSSDCNAVGLYRQASLPSVENKAHFYYGDSRLDVGALAFSLVCRTSKVKGLSATDVLVVLDYSSQNN